MASRPERSDKSKASSVWLSYLISPCARTWLVTVPLHLIAFIVLYVASVRIMEGELLSVAGDAADERLAQIVREIEEAAMRPGQDPNRGHVF